MANKCVILRCPSGDANGAAAQERAEGARPPQQSKHGADFRGGRLATAGIQIVPRQGNVWSP